MIMSGVSGSWIVRNAGNQQGTWAPWDAAALAADAVDISRDLMTLVPGLDEAYAVRGP
jgi:hypothetical protein